MRYQGTLAVWHRDKNFGFINPCAENSGRVFLHRSRIESGSPEVDAKVEYEIAAIRSGAYPSAINVVIVAATEGGAR